MPNRHYFKYQDLSKKGNKTVKCNYETWGALPEVIWEEGELQIWRFKGSNDSTFGYWNTRYALVLIQKDHRCFNSHNYSCFSNHNGYSASVCNLHRWVATEIKCISLEDISWRDALKELKTLSTIVNKEEYELCMW